MNITMNLNKYWRNVNKTKGKKNDLEKDQLFVHILHSSSTAEGPGGSKS
jgi:hypothetical protein